MREGLFCFRRKLDATEALVEEARTAALDVERFRRDLASHAIVEAFGAHLEEARAVPDEAREAGQVKAAGAAERVSFPSAVFIGEDGARHGVYGLRPYEEYRDAAVAAGAHPVGEPAPAIRMPSGASAGWHRERWRWYATCRSPVRPPSSGDWRPSGASGRCGS